MKNLQFKQSKYDPNFSCILSNKKTIAWLIINPDKTVGIDFSTSTVKTFKLESNYKLANNYSEALATILSIIH